MRIIVQRVKHASVEVGGQVTGNISVGLLVLLGIAKTDTTAEADYLADRLLGLRIFADSDGRMNLNVLQAGGRLLIVPNFTIYGDCRKGRRPAFDLAAPAEQARSLYEYFVARLDSNISGVQTGIFQAHMEVSLVNDGPVTVICDSIPT